MIVMDAYRDVVDFLLTVTAAVVAFWSVLTVHDRIVLRRERERRKREWSVEEILKREG